jgi:hypothetical protein
LFTPSFSILFQLFNFIEALDFFLVGPTVFSHELLRCACYVLVDHAVELFQTLDPFCAGAESG